jgi:hypothetical protein
VAILNHLEKSEAYLGLEFVQLFRPCLLRLSDRNEILVQPAIQVAV